MSTFSKDTLRGYYNGDLASLRVICALENNNEIPDYLNAKASVENNKIVIDYNFAHHDRRCNNITGKQKIPLHEAIFAWHALQSVYKQASEYRMKNPGLENQTYIIKMASDYEWQETKHERKTVG